MRFGFAVKVLGDGGLRSHDTRRWQSGPHLRVSIERMHEVLGYLDRNDIRMYRMASALVPYATHPHLPQFHGRMDQPAEAVVVVHVGARGDDLPAASDRFVTGFERLSERARSRLVLENDDRLFGLGDVLRLSSRTGLRIVWDAHHHACHNPDRIPEREALRLALGTWPRRVVPKLHYSSPKTAVDRPGSLPPRTAHADLVDPFAFGRFLRDVVRGTDVDVMLEAKAKDLAVLRLRDELASLQPTLTLAA